MAGQDRKPRRRRRWDIGRLVARVFCTLFALIGTLPLLGGLLVRSEPVLSWAASETARVLQEQLGLQARYRVRIELWPLQVSMHDLEVPALTGKGAAFAATRISVTPRIFSLLAGRLDVGDIEIDAPRGHLLIRHGKIANVAYRLPERRGPDTELTRAPFSSLAVTDAVLSVDVDGFVIETGAFDLDVFAGWGPSFEVSLRAAETRLERSRELRLGGEPGEQEDAARGRQPRPNQLALTAVDEDVVCGLDLRANREPRPAATTLLASRSDSPSFASSSVKGSSRWWRVTSWHALPLASRIGSRGWPS
jgi:translocation and assembly module TamB